ncbi:MAG: hypothetical protein HQ525_11515 [Anaerolineae bacterium]|nr:hypothetical protein [Anaerolineae bacterium]
MKKQTPQSRIVYFAILGVALAFLSAAYGPTATVAQVATPTPTSTVADTSLQIGSTNGILTLAIIITLIIIIPILWNLPFWVKENQRESQF